MNYSQVDESCTCIDFEIMKYEEMKASLQESINSLQNRNFTCVQEEIEIYNIINAYENQIASIDREISALRALKNDLIRLKQQTQQTDAELAEKLLFDYYYIKKGRISRYTCSGMPSDVYNKIYDKLKKEWKMSEEWKMSGVCNYFNIGWVDLGL